VSNKKETGQEGENLAANFLVAKGYEIVARNYRYRKGEIDLIVQKDDWLLFVEVKTRSATNFGEPESFVNMKQLNRIIDAAEAYIYANDWQGHIRFDIVSIKVGGWEAEIDHFEDVVNYG
jgi:putative endonuclease